MTSPAAPSGSIAPELIIAGASTRSAAFSALRAGFRPYCLDRYGDADLHAVATVRLAEDYPHGLIAALEHCPDAPIMYVGALENAGHVLELMEMGRLLAGNSREIVRRVRNPELVADAFREFNLPFLDVHGMHDIPPRDGNWLVKPLYGAGGRGIACWTADTPTPNEPHYFQQRAVGDSYSAVFVAPPDQRDVRFVGITRQVIGNARLGGGPFAWGGSIGPETLSVEIEQLVRRIGNVLSWKLGVIGLFGFDFVVDSEGLPRLTEVNPRYTGSVEVLEHTLNLALVRDHCAMFGMELPESAAASPGVSAMGKFILYSDRDWLAPDPADWLLPDEWTHSEMWRHVPRLADIPAAGTTVRAGHPLCSLFVTGATPSECLDGMSQHVASALSRLGLPPR